MQIQVGLAGVAKAKRAAGDAGVIHLVRYGFKRARAVAVNDLDRVRAGRGGVDEPAQFELRVVRAQAMQINRHRAVPHKIF